MGLHGWQNLTELCDWAGSVERAFQLQGSWQGSPVGQKLLAASIIGQSVCGALDLTASAEPGEAPRLGKAGENLESSSYIGTVKPLL